MAQDGPLLEVVVEPGSEQFGPDDPGWRAQVVALRRSLQTSEIDGLRRTERPAPGHKAGVEAVIITLGTSGAIAAATEVIRSWLARDRTRQIRLSYQDGDRQVTIQVDGATVSDAAMASALTTALHTLPGRD